MEEAPPSYTPQAIHDILPLYHPEDSDGHVQAYTLRQLSNNTQIISPIRDQAVEAYYHIKTFATGGFMNKKPHIIISKGETSNAIEPTSSSASQDCNNGNFASSRRFSILPRRDSDTQTITQTNLKKNPQPLPVAEARFDIHGTGTRIAYISIPSPQGEQRLDLENSQAQTLRTTIGGTRHYWQPFPGNKSVLELLNEMEEIVARFTYTVPAAVATGAATGRKKSIAADMEVGELHVVEALVGGEQEKEEIICSAAVVIERARRRAVNIGYQGIGYKQGAACGPTMGAYGGGAPMLM